jgi:hypothetical protein
MVGSLTAVLAAVLFAAGCSGGPPDDPGNVELKPPKGYMSVLSLELDGVRYDFGPFVGYYFRPEDPEDLTKLRFVCFNERNFYTLDLPENALLYEGTAVLEELSSIPEAIPLQGGRIRPVFFDEAPEAWLQSRPEPRDEYVHFHSCRNAAGPSFYGFWIRHVAAADFTYDMGGRVGPDSPLFHEVKKGVDRDFARIVEFDFGKD